MTHSFETPEIHNFFPSAAQAVDDVTAPSKGYPVSVSTIIVYTYPTSGIHDQTVSVTIIRAAATWEIPRVPAKCIFLHLNPFIMNALPRTLKICL